jgi:hypothetical protein
MTAKGELYINENCRDAFENKLNVIFGKDWNLDGSPYGDIWDMAKFPDIAEVEVKDDDDSIIGKVKIFSNFTIEDAGDGKYVEISPEHLEVITFPPNRKYKVVCYMRVDSEEGELLTFEEALKEQDQAELMQPENIYKIEAVKVEDKKDGSSP